MFGLITQRRFNELQEKHDKFQSRIKDYETMQAKNEELNIEIHSLKNQLTEIKKQIREQTEADLFFTVSKIQKKLLDGEPKENLYELNQQRFSYQNQLAQLQSPLYPQSSFLNGIGLGQLFGGLGR